MRSSFKVLLAIGLAGIAAALAARLSSRPGSAPSSAPSTAPPVGPTPPTAPPAAAPAPAVQAVQAVGAPADGFLVPAADAPLVEAEGALRLGGWLRSHLPMCGREADVALRAEPGGTEARGSLPSCEAAYGEFPSVSLLPIGPLRGDWIKIGDGWARVAEVRSAELVVVGGREYWHDLFNADAKQIGGRVILVKGDADPCASEVCGSQNALIEQGEAIRARYEAAHPGGLPPRLQRGMEREIEELNAATEKEWSDQQKALEHRAREERTLELPGTPAPGGKVKVDVEGGSYLCCT